MSEKLNLSHFKNFPFDWNHDSNQNDQFKQSDMFDLIVIVINVEFNTIKPNEKHSDANNTIRSKTTKKTIEYEHDFFVLYFESRNLDLLKVITSCKALHVRPYKKNIYSRKNVSNLKEYCMTPSSSIYVWKEEKPEKPVVATKIEKN